MSAPMRPTLATGTVLVLALALAGCIDPATEAAVAPAPSDAPAGGIVEGAVFLPPSSGEDRVETLVEIPANSSAMRVVADLVLGSRYGPLEAPLQTGDVLVEIRGPDGAALVDAHLGPQETQARLEAETLADGAHTLAILSYGGSDGQANGDYVSYRVEAVPIS